MNRGPAQFVAYRVSGAPGRHQAAPKTLAIKLVLPINQLVSRLFYLSLSTITCHNLRINVGLGVGLLWANLLIERSDLLAKVNMAMATG